MKFLTFALNYLAPLVVWALGSVPLVAQAQEEAPGMTKMCLFYEEDGVSGHVRSDPILSQVCPSGHVHTFYGPQNFHPNTSYEDLRATKPQHSTTPWIENQSLYWHPSIYRVTKNPAGGKIYTRVSRLESSPYYRWNTSTKPATVEFPPGFRMIAYSNQERADVGGETGGNLLVECCNDGEACVTTSGNPLLFPRTRCGMMGLAFAMPTCWNTTAGIGDAGDPKGHVAYTLDGSVGGDCPPGYDARIPQVQLFVRINDYEGGKYMLSDRSDVFHMDFLNGWEKGKLEEIMAGCEPSGEPGYNPPCDCAEEFLTVNYDRGGAVCDGDVKKYILNEETAVVSKLPKGPCEGTELVPRSWEADDPPFDGECGTESDCADSNLAFIYKKMAWNCGGVEDSDNKKKLCKNRKIKSHCPVVCDAEDLCEQDSKAKFVQDKNGKNTTCKKIKKKKKCHLVEVCGTCRKTCAGFDDCNYFD